MDLFKTILQEFHNIENSEEKQLLKLLIGDSTTLSSLLARVLSKALKTEAFGEPKLRAMIVKAIVSDKSLEETICYDLNRYLEFDYSANHLYEVVFFRKGFQALLAYRVSNYYYKKGLLVFSEWFRHRSTIVFQVDISPRATLGRGIVLDHATGIVIGETSVVGNNCSIFHNVTLGSTTRHPGRRHPNVGDGVLIGCGASLIGNVEIESDTVVKASKVMVK